MSELDDIERVPNDHPQRQPWELEPEEILTLTPEFLAQCGCTACQEWQKTIRAIATAAGKKAYAQGRQEMGREIVEWLSSREPTGHKENTEALEAWLRKE